jgi:hypothetical protein
MNKQEEAAGRSRKKQQKEAGRSSRKKQGRDMMIAAQGEE